jgi:hypothetical protein
VNDLGEYLTAASDNLREAGGNALTAYTFSSLEQYIPLFLMQTVRVIAGGGGILAKSALTLNGVEALDRSGSVLYRDLKGATGFDNSFWDDELAAISFERSASFMAMLELEMEEVRIERLECVSWALCSLVMKLALLLLSNDWQQACSGQTCSLCVSRKLMS